MSADARKASFINLIFLQIFETILNSIAILFKHGSAVKYFFMVFDIIVPTIYFLDLTIRIIKIILLSTKYTISVISFGILLYGGTYTTNTVSRGKHPTIPLQRRGYRLNLLGIELDGDAPRVMSRKDNGPPLRCSLCHPDQIVGFEGAPVIGVDGFERGGVLRIILVGHGTAEALGRVMAILTHPIGHCRKRCGMGLTRCRRDTERGVKKLHTLGGILSNLIPHRVVPVSIRKCQPCLRHLFWLTDRDTAGHLPIAATPTSYGFLYTRCC
ncbi:hypothetical protein C8233_04325 [Halomonas sp. SF2003]|nr:hypothetical protein C8233_04325 [Halomonas sp. SF2003]